MFVIPFRFQGKYFILSPTRERDPKEQFRVSGVALTRSGVELSRIVDLETVDTYDRALAAYFRSKHLRLKAVA